MISTLWCISIFTNELVDVTQTHLLQAILEHQGIILLIKLLSSLEGLRLLCLLEGFALFWYSGLLCMRLAWMLRASSAVYLSFVFML